MARTRVPTTLAEYQEFVRAEAIKVQADMGWPDDRLNATLKALGLPEKHTFLIPVEVTGTTVMFIQVTDQPTEEAARATVTVDTPEQAKQLAADKGITLPFEPTAVKVADKMPELARGGIDITLTNPLIRAQQPGVRQCEQYNNAGTHYCTMPRGHAGQHARGNGRTIDRVWA